MLRVLSKLGEIIDMCVLRNHLDQNYKVAPSRYFHSFRMLNSEVFDPCETFLSYCKCNYGVVILDVPINFSHSDVLVNLWTKAKVRVTVDGGTDRWLHWLRTNEYGSNLPPPDLITGDLDSVSPEALNYFSDLKVHIVKTPDQNHTDFTKALWQLKYYCNDRKFQVDCLYVLADTSGRLDQILGNIHTLFLANDILPSCKIFQVASNSISWLLTPGKHSISIPEKLRKSKEWCALVPIGHFCQVSTTGLKWNLNNTILKFGKLVSTSNTYDGSPVVTVETDHPVLWSMGIQFLY